MLLDELREQLKNRQDDITAIRSFWHNAKLAEKFAELDAQVNAEDFWKNPQRDPILVQHRKLRILVEEYHIVDKQYADLSELVEFFKDNEQELASIKSDVAALCKKITKFKIQLILNKDRKSVV